jgi:hypothetical protein
MMNRIIGVLDRMAVGFSIICALHCFLLPVVVVFLPILISTPLADARYHQLMLWLVLPTSIFALTLGCRKHKNLRVIAFGVLGILILAFSAFFGHDLLGAYFEKIVTLVGGTILAYGHLCNHKLCKACECHSHDDC